MSEVSVEVGTMIYCKGIHRVSNVSAQLNLPVDTEDEARVMMAGIQTALPEFGGFVDIGNERHLLAMSPTEFVWVYSTQSCWSPDDWLALHALRRTEQNLV